jgi:hypothetical protein
MKKIDVGETMQIVANLSVIAGLAFIAFQVRQNTVAVQAQTLQSLEESSVTYLENLARDPETRAIVFKLNANPDEVTLDEAMRVSLLVRAQFTRYQSAYLQWQKGSLSEPGWIAYTKTICGSGSQLSNPWARAQAITWPLLRNDLLEEFRDFTEKCRPDLAALIKAAPVVKTKESVPVAN